MSPRRPQSFEDFMHEIDAESFDDGTMPLFDDEDLASIQIPPPIETKNLKNQPKKRKKK